jgi:hypothetical protein
MCISLVSKMKEKHHAHNRCLTVTCRFLTMVVHVQPMSKMYVLQLNKLYTVTLQRKLLYHPQNMKFLK